MTLPFLFYLGASEVEGKRSGWTETTASTLKEAGPSSLGLSIHAAVAVIQSTGCGQSTNGSSNMSRRPRK